MIDRGSTVSLRPGVRLQWEQAQQAYVLLYPEGMVTLNSSASEVLKRCDGARTVGDIITELKHQFPDADLASDVIDFLEVAHDEGWLRHR